MMQYYRVENLPAVLGLRVRDLRKKKGYTQERFAELLYVDVRTVRHWECEGITRVDVIADIAAALGLSWRELFSDGEELPLFIFHIYMTKPRREDRTRPVGGAFPMAY